ncbi:GntR family transcriptional regulator [Clostridium sp. BJN0001]|uniref:GntR family transcriptional regulator n=1 Tax=Clostridium sp. BJN0001 TaxID=2930219 RepID=UPI001FD13839|nr:GntR family transcriptional regulator [Clostridium sp. BJN0001]
MVSLGKIKKGATLKEQSYKIIKDAIMKNEIKSGEVLAEQQLAEKLSISRTPIREALNRLVYENIAKVNSNNSIVVADITTDEIEDITKVRTVLETLSITLLKGKMDDKKFEELNSLINEHIDALKNNYMEKVLECDFCFHVKLAEFTENKFLLSTIESANLIIRRFLILSGTLEKYSRLAAKEHEDVYKELKKGNYDIAQSKMNTHLTNVNKRMLNK